MNPCGEKRTEKLFGQLFYVLYGILLVIDEKVLVCDLAHFDDNAHTFVCV